MFSDGISFLIKGGPIMWPLFVCGILSVAVILERFLYFRKAAEGGPQLAERALALIKAGRTDEALQILRFDENPVAALVVTALKNSTMDPNQLEGLLEIQALEAMPKLTHRLNVLDTIITIAPLLGLLGTVTGMIGAFHAVGDPSSLSSPGAITGGVAEALIATATGLTIAIITLVCYNSFGEKAKSITSNMELAATQALYVVSSSPLSASPKHETLTA